MTERLYEKDAYCREFTANVLSCDFENGFYNIVLDKTAFFPEGGGQAPDKGILNGIEVLDVQIHDGVIIHKTNEKINAGDKVCGKLDWETRFRRMQNHSGEHILSGTVHALFGYNNVGFHMSKNEMTVDFDGMLKADDIARVEEITNSVIYRNLPIDISYPAHEEAVQLQYRSKLDITENLRLVTIGDVDCCACCAPHVARTGEVGVVKVIDFTPNKGGTRLTVKAGADAFSDYAMLNRQTKSLMKTLSVSRELVSDAAEKQLELINSLRYENGELRKRLAWSELSPICYDACTVAFEKNLTYDELRHCANKLLEGEVRVCLLFSTDDGENYIYIISGKDADIRPAVKALNDAFAGKGGGKPNYAQGKITGSEEKIKEFVQGFSF